eukprot:TRINITY_DN94518_c0_g1_i1.p1 TRINITY_DN94518_c0_g1~~TRINITY_DN94518_c0_g1_i1.p1  ORF type:complete len:398 (+),score=31.98 TRINITY_DN94518_c0_g1_i1:23-1195(+)
MALAPAAATEGTPQKGRPSDHHRHRSYSSSRLRKAAIVLLPLSLPGAECSFKVVPAATKDNAECWTDCLRTGFYCPEYCCWPPDGIGNPTCWDKAGYFGYSKCCAGLPPVEEPFWPPTMVIGSVNLTLYRGPSDYNSPKYTERTVEIALGMWFMRRALDYVSRHREVSHGAPVEVGNVLSQYWPLEDRLRGYIVPWMTADLGDNGIDASEVDFQGSIVLSISTVEHVGYDNEGARQEAIEQGFRTDNSVQSLTKWVKAWDESAELLIRIVSQAKEFLITFPIGFNPRLDAVVSRTPWLRDLTRVVHRTDIQNRWRVDKSTSFKYFYDKRDIYREDSVGQIYHPKLPEAYQEVYGDEMPWDLPLPAHPRFRFANAVACVTNVPELLADFAP